MKLICLILFINVIASTAVSQVPEWVWGRGAEGSYGLCFPKAAIADKSGNSYVTGIYDGNNVVFGTTTLYNHGNPGYNSNDDIFLVKYDANGNVVWVKNFGGTFGDHVNSIALDSSGNIFIAGTYFYGPISFGNVSLPANTGQDMFIAKFDNNGNAVWARNAGSNNCYANGIEVNGSGDVFITGGFSSQTITIGSTLLTNSSMGMYDFFVARYNSNGTALWAKSGGGTNHDHLSKLTVDNLGNVYVCGCYNSPVISIGSYSFSHAGGTYPANDIFIAKYSASGNIEWARSIGGTGNDEVNGIEADDFGHFFIAGKFSSDSLIIDTAVLQNTSSQLDILFAGFNSNGSLYWAKSFGTIYGDNAQDVTLDSIGNVYFTGGFTGQQITFDQTTLNEAPLFVIKLRNDGDEIWALGADNTGGLGSCIATGEYGDVFVSGLFNNDSLILNENVLHGYGTVSDFFIGKISLYSVNITHTNVSCTGLMDGTAAAVMNGGIPPFTYIWNTSPVQTTQMATNLSPGIYSVTVTDSTGVSLTGNVTVSQPNEIHSYNQVTICNGDSVFFSGSFLDAPGIYFDTLIADNGCDSIAELGLIVHNNDTSFQTVGICPGTDYNFYGDIISDPGLYNHQLLSSFGCDSIIILQLYNFQDYSLVNPQSICEGGFIEVNGNIYTLPGIYIDTLQSENGCDSVITTILSVESSPDIPNVPVGNTIICESGGSVYLPSSPYPSGISWHLTPVAAGNIEYSSSDSCIVFWNDSWLGAAGIFVSSSNACDTVYSDTLQVVANRYPDVFLGDDITICIDNSIELSAGHFSETSFLWQNGNEDSVLTINEEGYYWVRASNICGSSCDTILIRTFDCNCPVYIPNIFSPNNDNQNDILFVRGQCIIQMHMFIYDRWGNKMFESSDIHLGWDGTKNGCMVDPGVYQYILLVKMNNGDQRKIEGNVTLVR